MGIFDKVKKLFKQNEDKKEKEFFEKEKIEQKIDPAPDSAPEPDSNSDPDSDPDQDPDPQVPLRHMQPLLVSAQ